MKAVRHTGIVVSDIGRALHFYRDLIGLKIIKDVVESGQYIDNMLAFPKVKVRTIKMLADNGSMLELLVFSSPLPKVKEKRSFYGIGISHVAFTVENLETEYVRLKEGGVVFNTPPQLSPDGCAKVTFCRDSDGNLIELVEERK